MVNSISSIDTSKTSTKVRKVGEVQKSYPKHKTPLFFTVTEIESGLITYYVKAAPESSIDSIDTKRFEILQISKNSRNSNLFDYKYIERKQ